MTKCSCGKVVPAFSPNPNYCCKACEEKCGNSEVESLKRLFGMQ